MSRRTAPRLLLGLIAMLATLVEPVASLLHGIEHAAESHHGHSALVGISVGSLGTTQLRRGVAAVALETPEHDAEHAALHLAAQPDASLVTDGGAAMPAHCSGFLEWPLAPARGRSSQRRDEPPDVRLRSRDLARAPPLA